MREPAEIQADANAALKAGDEYIQAAEYDTALKSLVIAKALYEELGDANGIVRTMQSIGNVNYFNGAANEALAVWREALDKNSLISEQPHLARLTVNVGNAMLKLGNIPEALEHYKRGLSINEEGLRDERLSAQIHINLGVLYYNSSMYPDALESWNRAMELQTLIGDEEKIAELLTNLGNIQAALGSNELALDYYDKAIEQLEQLNSRRNLARAYSGKAIVNSRMLEYDEAVRYFKKAIELWKAMRVHSIVVEVTTNLVDTLISAGRMDEAKEHLELLDIEKVVDVQTQLHIHLSHGWFLESLSDFDGAINRYETALSMASTSGYRAEESSAHQYLRDIAKKQGDFDSYIMHNDAHTQIKEEVSGKGAALKIAMIEKQNELAAIDKERDKERAILYSALPKHIADRMLRGERVSGDHFDNAAVMFIDIVGFTTLSESMPASEVVLLLEKLFTQFDEVCKENNITKIKTIGDSYLAVAFPSLVPTSSTFQVPSSKEEISLVASSRYKSQQVATSIANAALQIIEQVKQFNFKSLQSLQVPSISSSSFESLRVAVRVGLHCGPITAGVIGTERLQYDVWGDTVNVASRLESTSEPNKIHVSSSFALALQGDEVTGRQGDMEPGTWHMAHEVGTWHMAHEVGTWHMAHEVGTWHLALRGETSLKGKGTMTTYWLEQL